MNGHVDLTNALNKIMQFNSSVYMVDLANENLQNRRSC